ncbi:YCF48-related protein [Variovorax sp. J22R115]|uniref:WD40/YVTN/BNR-like repeat-containing protein n=1 Tax=Variovorax sp. J22R115 TaxID=3053509 RepID=UPI0025757183|nr:YCF48-related protein [Variovorax sp. J22R115]MDM0047423.1 YCF48-related protein [Variovorax sp. J22R115]
MVFRKTHWSAAALCTALVANAVSAEPVFQTPTQVPAARSALATRVTFNALAMAGGRMVVAGQRGHILLSEDGAAWKQAQVPVSSDLTALSFPTPNEGWAVGHEGVILHTSNGGESWDRRLDGKQAAALILKAYGTPGRTDDPAAQRLKVDAEAFAAQGADKPFLDVWFEDSEKGFAIGAFNLILRTEDGGKTWTPWLDRIDNPKGLHLYAVRRAGGAVFIVGEQGLVLKLDREGQRFVNVPLPYQGTLFGVVGTKAVTVVFGLRGNALRSTDGGATWARVDTGVNAGLASGLVRPDGAIVLVSQAGDVLLSTDDGASFARVKVANAAPTFAVAQQGKGTLALAGVGGVRLQQVK